MADQPALSRAKELLDREMSHFTEKLAGLGTASPQEKRSVLKHHHERMLALAKSAEAGLNAPKVGQVYSRPSTAQRQAPAPKSPVQELHDAFKHSLAEFERSIERAGLEELHREVVLETVKANATRIGSGVHGLPLAAAPCANAHPSCGRVCEARGAHACAACHLVSYCRKECQKEHWPVHKRDCKHSDVGPGWQPRWKREGRRPNWLTEGIPQLGPLSEHLWGNTPAFSLLGPPGSEAARGLLQESDDVIRLCFAASGDLRNVVSTIAGLPVGYRGRVRVIANDHNPKTAARNLVLLQILGQLGEDGIDMAIAVWHSLAVTEAQDLALSLLVDNLNLEEVLEDDSKASWAVKKSRSRINARFARPVWARLVQMMTSPLTLQSAADQRAAKLGDPSRADFVDRMLQSFRPFHRASIARFRDFGLLLPFGAFNAHHNTPSKFLLDPEAGYTLDHLADPLWGWRIDEVLEAGKRHNVPKNDLHGSLFFLLRERLASVVEKMRTAEIVFELFCEDASDLANRLRVTGVFDAGEKTVPAVPGGVTNKSGSGSTKQRKRRGKSEGTEPPAPRHATEVGLFQRVEVSNICDENYVGVTRVLRDWGRLLAPGGVLVGLFMNWTTDVSSGTARLFAGMKPDEYLTATRRVGEAAKKCPGVLELVQSQMMQFDGTALPNFGHDYSKDFEAYLRQRGAVKEAAKQGLVRSGVHQIVAPRLGVPVGAPKKSVPIEFLKTVDDWYWSVFANDGTGTEVYTEWVKQR